VIMIDMQR